MVLAFEGLDVGRRMLAWAAHFVLFPDDEVFVVLCSKARARAAARATREACAGGAPHVKRLWAAWAELARVLWNGRWGPSHMLRRFSLWHDGRTGSSQMAFLRA